MKDFTDILAIIDRSGSMEHIQDATEEGFNGFVRTQRETPGDCALSLYQFDDRYEAVFEDRPIAQVGPYQLVPRGTTALLDALGRTITARGAHYAALPEEQRPARVVVVVVTDGRENASREYTLGQVKELVTRQQEVYQWQFVFLGANMDAMAEARGLGISMDHAMSFSADEEGVAHSYRSLSLLVSSYKSQDPGTVMASFSPDDREKAGRRGTRR